MTMMDIKKKNIEVNNKRDGELVYTEKEIFKQFINKLGKDILYYFPSLIIPAFVSIANVAIFTRIFNPETYGIYALVIATAAIFMALFSQWIQASTLRFFAEFKKKGEQAEFNKNLILILFLISGILIMIFVFLYPLINSAFIKYKRFYLYTIIFIIFSILFENLCTLFQADLRSSGYSKYKIINSINRLFFSLAFIFFIARDILGLIVGSILSCAILFYPMVKELNLINYYRKARKGFSLSFVKKFASFGFPMLGWFAGSEILNLSDRFILEHFKGSTQVGIYSANYSLLGRGIGLIFSPILLAAHPLILNVWEKSNNKIYIQKLITSISRYFFLMAVPIIVYISFLSKSIAFIFLGKSYHEGYIIIPVIAIAFALWHLSLYAHKTLEIRKKTIVMFYSIIVCAITNILLNLIFIPLYGYIGAAITTLISYLIYLIIIYFATKQDIRLIFPWKSIFNILVASTTLTIYLWILKLLMKDIIYIVYLILFIISIFIYIGFLYLIGEIRKYEIKFFKNLFLNKLR